MLGNDVVDLAGEMPTHVRFDARVFVDAERRALAASGAPDVLRWILWAAKESAFKALRRMDRSVTFSPARFCVTLDARARDSGTHWMRVDHARHRLRVRADAREGHVHAIAWLGDATPESTLLGVTAIAPGASPREAVRRLACDALARTFGCPASELEVAREERLPRLLRRGATLPAVLSLSHHGRFVAFACRSAVECKGGAPS